MLTQKTDHVDLGGERGVTQGKEKVNACEYIAQSYTFLWIFNLSVAEQGQLFAQLMVAEVVQHVFKSKTR